MHTFCACYRLQPSFCVIFRCLSISRARPVTLLHKSSLNLLQISCKSNANLMQISCKSHANLTQISLGGDPLQSVPFGYADWVINKETSSVFRCVSTSINLCMTMYDYVWLCMTMYAYVWLSITIYDYVWLFMIMYDYVQGVQWELI